MKVKQPKQSDNGNESFFCLYFAGLSLYDTLLILKMVKIMYLYKSDIKLQSKLNS